MRAMNFSQLDFGLFLFKIYGILVSFAFFIGSWHFYKMVKEKNFSLDFFLHHYWRWLLGGILLGRLMAVLLEPEVFSAFGIFTFFAFWEGEVNFYGVVAGFILTMYFDLYKYQKPFWKWSDLGIVSFLLGILITDLAAFLTGAIYGRETEMPWGVQYETFGVELVAPVHPLPLYAFFIHFLLLHWARTRCDFLSHKRPGELSLKTISVFVFADFWFQALRGDASYYFLSLRLEQWFDVLVFTACLWVLYVREPIYKKFKKNKLPT